MAAAACGQRRAVVAPAVSGKKTLNYREYNKRNRENSRRRQAALLFLTNISLDGRPVLSNSAENGRSYNKEPEFDRANPGSAAASAAADPCAEPAQINSCGTFDSLPAAVSCGVVTPGSNAGLTVPPILVLPSDNEFNDVGSAEVLLGYRRGSSPSPGDGNLLAPSPSDNSLLPSPLGPRKSSTLLSVQSCNSVSSEPRHR